MRSTVADDKKASQIRFWPPFSLPKLFVYISKSPNSQTLTASSPPPPAAPSSCRLLRTGPVVPIHPSGALPKIVVHIFTVDILGIADKPGAILAPRVTLFEAEEFES